jgi:pimeloyl-ACP methyl ester carboxylesterase
VKTVLIFPGFRKSENDYLDLMEAIRRAGYDVLFVPLDWDQTIAEWVQYAREVYERLDPQDAILAGFSFGAMVAFLLAGERNPWELWLLSLSGRFAKDIPFMLEESKELLGPRRMEAFAQLSFDALVERITCKTVLIIGELEYKEPFGVPFRVHETHERLSVRLGHDRVKIAKAPDVGHNPNLPNYWGTLLQFI